MDIFSPNNKIAGRYQIISLLGQSEKSRVFKVVDLTTDQAMALKVFSGQDNGIHHLQHEFRFLSSLRHPNLVQVHNFGSERDFHFFTMDLVEGRDFLAGLLEVPMDERLRLTAELCRALEYIHQNDIIHLDLKPSNVLIPAGGAVKLTDFGLAHSSKSRGLLKAAGTPSYMSPEVIAGQMPDGRSDLYSLGVLLYQVFSGRLPFEAPTTEELVKQHILKSPQPPKVFNPDIPDEMQLLILRLLAKDPNERPASANEVIQEMNRGFGLDLALEQGQAASRNLFHSRLVGRDKEMADLFQALQLAAGGHGTCVFISGETGIGRTRLLSEFALQAQLRDAQVFWTRCYSPDSAAYEPVIQLLSQLLPLAQSFCPEVVSLYGPELMTLLPHWRGLTEIRDHPLPTQLPPNETKLRLLDAISNFIFRTFETLPTSPSVIILEGLHWVDSESLEAIYHLGRNASRSRVLLVGSMRSDDIDEHHPLLGLVERLSLENQAEQVYLKRLSSPEVLALLGNVFYHAEGLEPLALKIYEETEGNPLLIEEAVFYLLESGQIRRRLGQWQVDPYLVQSLALPAGFKQALERKLQALNRHQLRALQGIAVMGRPVSEKMLAFILEAPEDQVTEDLIHLKGRNLLIQIDSTEGPLFGMHHARIEREIHSGLEPELSAALHRRASRLLEQMGPSTCQDFIELARHHEKAGQAEGAKSCHLRAASLLADHAPDQAIVHYQAALRLCSSAEQAEVLRPLLNLYFLAGDSSRAAKAASDLLKLAGPSADLYRRMGACQDRLGDYKRAIDYFNQGLSLAQGDPVTTARIVSSLAATYLHQGELRTAERSCLEALKVLPPESDPLVEAELYNNLGQIYWQLAEWAQAVSVHRKSLQLKERLGDQYGIATSYNNLGQVYYRMYDWDRAAESHQKSFSIRERIGDISGLARSYNNLALIYRHLYDWDKAVDYHTKCLQTMERIGSSYELAVSHTNLGLIHKARSEWDQAIWSYNRAILISSTIGARNVLLDAYIRISELYLSLGSIESAGQYCQQALDLAAELGGRLEQGRGMNIQGRIYQMRRQWDRAQELLVQAKEIFSDLDIRAGEAFILKNLADLHRARGELRQSSLLADRALSLAQRVEEQQLVAEIILLKGELMEEEGSSGLVHLQWALELALRINIRETVWPIYGALARHAAKAGNLPGALDYYQRALAVFKQSCRNISQPELKNCYLFEPRRRQLLRDIKKLRQEVSRNVSLA
ncbi:MAG TPA: hypothetical protein DDW31_01105 [candidate division Zixibacteria bacterium]|jgi:predicted ATPase|nr:hypothetical protein [candidate division Zixibacteria bacterium]